MKPPLLAAVLIALTVQALPATARNKRSQTAKVEFKKAQPCPATGAIKGPCKGWVLDHVIPLACGGPDSAANLQWQTVAEAKQKDKWERQGCTKVSGEITVKPRN